MPKRRPRKKAQPEPAQPPASAKKRRKGPEAPVPDVTVVANGTDVSTTVIVNGSNTLGRPQFVEPTSPHAVLSNLVSRSSLDPQEELEPLSPTITSLKNTVRAMSLGESIEPHKEHIQQIAANQPEKGDVVRAHVNQADFELLADYVEMRQNAVRHIKRASRRNDLSVSEALVVWRMTNDEIPTMVKNIGKNDKAVDTTTVVEKIDFRRQQVERTVQQRWAGTTPQGRELIRKKLWKLKRDLLAQNGIHPPRIEVDATEAPEPEDEPVTTQNPA